ncbi:DEAD/DEAH box helicase family protein [Mycoplasmopsis alligatoris]|uniref:Type III restriction enzyme, res subunit n=1 Tax=Mycoplasmopsis alligatoris A21JP2 TaxID=747682 RepID=D4XVZ0_9BACT|nr:DEAD/DEAH box helicase family protein [Mycoplasmopsis alligatoris]EFF41489.1 type III restriction enzyme, res subunit [Mycoplasmopsis alligatoris A21JP2]
MQLTSSQLRVVNELFEAFKNKEEVCLSAVTGSGKTFISSELISRIFAYNNLKMIKTIIVVGSISNADLPKQFANKLISYQKYHDYKNYSIMHVESPSTSKNTVKDYVANKLDGNVNNVVYVLGTASFRKGSIFVERNILGNFIREIQNNRTQLVYIRDEAHIQGKHESKQTVEALDGHMRQQSDFLMEMTATPKKNKKIVTLSAEDIKNDGDKNLLKFQPVRLEFDTSELSEEKFIDEAIKQFKESKKEYALKIDENINPAMLIQVINDSEIDKEKKIFFEKSLELLEKRLQSAGLVYLKYFGAKNTVVGANRPNTLEYASKNDSDIDVIIFKIGPATGWDIPRANTLLQLRNVSSNTLNTQTVGRIKRNPLKNLKYNSVTDKYFIFSNFKEDANGVGIYQLKEEYKEKKYIVGRINRNSSKIIKSQVEYSNKVINYINSIEFKEKIYEYETNGYYYDKEKIGNSQKINYINNYFELKIYNLNRYNEHQENLMLFLFNKTLEEFAHKNQKNIEKIKYVFVNSIHKLQEFLQTSNRWVD